MKKLALLVILRYFLFRGKGKMMKSATVLGLIGILFSLVICLSGCTQPGETAAEGHRRHLRNLRLNQENLMRDIDRAFLFNEPSQLTEYRIP